MLQRRTATPIVRFVVPLEAMYRPYMQGLGCHCLLFHGTHIKARSRGQCACGHFVKSGCIANVIPPEFYTASTRDLPEAGPELGKDADSKQGSFYVVLYGVVLAAG